MWVESGLFEANLSKCSRCICAGKIWLHGYHALPEAAVYRESGVLSDGPLHFIVAWCCVLWAEAPESLKSRGFFLRPLVFQHICRQAGGGWQP